MFFLKYTLAATITFFSAASGAYIAEELCVIGWGEGPNQLMIVPESESYSPDSIEVEYHPGGGPCLGFIDSNENIFIVSQIFSQIKCFDRNGNLILDKPNLAPGVCPGAPNDVYIDSLSHFYLTITPAINYVPVVDLQGNLLLRLFPYADTLKKIERLFYDISGALFFWAFGDSFYISYQNGNYKQVDNICMQASDGYLYTLGTCGEEYPDSIKFIKYLAPERTFPFISTDSIILNLPGEEILYSELLIGGNGSSLYVLVNRISQDYGNIYEFGLDYKINDQIEIAYPSRLYEPTISPFVDHQGHVYEFRFMDDGLHVIKWTKQ
jgi:hypothetical protein